MTEIVTLRELSKFLKIPISTAYQLAQGGRLPAIKIGKHWRVNLDQVKKMFQVKKKKKAKKERKEDRNDALTDSQSALRTGARTQIYSPATSSRRPRSVGRSASESPE